jgi:hypothetical protein
MGDHPHLGLKRTCQITTTIAGKTKKHLSSNELGAKK